MATTKKPRTDGVAVNFRMTDEQNTAILTLIAFHQGQVGSRARLSKASMAKDGLMREARRLEKLYADNLPANYIPLKA